MKTTSLSSATTFRSHRPLSGAQAAACALAVAVGLLHLLTVDSPAATDVGGLVSGNWTKEGSPYYLTNDIVVGSLLTIREGVEVCARSNYVFEVGGRLRVLGKPDEPVWFHPGDANIGWQGILFRDAVPGSFFVHATIEGSKQSGVRITNTPPAFTNCFVINNSTPGEGGGIKAELLAGGDLVLSGCTVTNNQAASIGGGVRLEMKGGQVLAERCLFGTNTAVSYGGGFQAFVKDTKLRFLDCTNINNQVTTSPRSSGGGGFYIQNRDGASFDLQLLGCHVAGNVVRSYHTGGSQGRYHAYAAGIGAFGAGTVTMQNCRILDNAAAQYHCCGIWNESYAYGGGVGLQDAKVTMLNCIVANNYSSGSHWNAGCGICVYSGALEIVNSTMVGNSGAGAGLYVNSGTCTILNSIFYNNADNLTQIYPETLKVDYSCVQGCYAGTSNICSSPALCKDNFALIQGSPCIDAGHPGLEYRDGCIDNSGECTPFARGTARNDMGAFGGPWVCRWTDPSPEAKIRTQPENDVVLEDDPGAFGVITTGDTPLNYQWYQGNVRIPGATNSVLRWLTVDLTNSSLGAASTNAYHVEVSNSLGSVSSMPVWLLVSELEVRAVQEGNKVWLMIRRQKPVAKCDLKFSETCLGPWKAWPTIATVTLNAEETRWQAPGPGYYCAVPAP